MARLTYKGKRWSICIAPRRENLTSKALRCGSHSLTCQHTTPAFTRSLPGGATTEWTVTAPADEAYYSLIDPMRMKGWVGLVGWPIADVWPTKWSSVQLAVRRRTAKVCRSKTRVLPLCYATNFQCSAFFRLLLESIGVPRLFEKCRHCLKGLSWQRTTIDTVISKKLCCQ